MSSSGIAPRHLIDVQPRRPTDGHWTSESHRHRIDPANGRAFFPHPVADRQHRAPPRGIQRHASAHYESGRAAYAPSGSSGASGFASTSPRSRVGNRPTPPPLERRGACAQTDQRQGRDRWQESSPRTAALSPLSGQRPCWGERRRGVSWQAKAWRSGRRCRMARSRQCRQHTCPSDNRLGSCNAACGRYRRGHQNG